LAWTFLASASPHGNVKQPGLAVGKVGYFLCQLLHFQLFAVAYLNDIFGEYRGTADQSLNRIINVYSIHGLFAITKNLDSFIFQGG
jgi:hypothetical protein